MENERRRLDSYELAAKHMERQCNASCILSGTNDAHTHTYSNVRRRQITREDYPLPFIVVWIRMKTMAQIFAAYISP